MSKIIKPPRRPIKRIEIEVDAGGQAQVNAKNLLNGGPLHPIDVVLNLLQISVSLLAAAITPAPGGKAIIHEVDERGTRGGPRKIPNEVDNGADEKESR